MTEAQAASDSPLHEVAATKQAWHASMNGALGFLLVCTAWLLVRPYQGVRHDAILYLGQALHSLRPGIFGRDLFFANGSQDSFTVVSAPLGWLLSTFGTANAEMASTAISNLAFAAAAWTLCGTLAPTRRWICTLSVALMSHAYARVSDFNYAENFFTARSLAEPLALLALVAWARRRNAWAAAWFTLAACCHPLVALPTLVVGWTLRVLEDRRWLWGSAALLPVAALAAAGVAPFAGALRRFDDTWWDLLRQFDAQVRMTSWDATDFATATLDLALVAIAWSLAQGRARHLLLAALVASALLVPTAFVGGDLVRDVLVVQLQLWRVLWLVHVLAMACLPVIVLDLWQEGEASRIAAAAAPAAVLAVSWTLPNAWIFLPWLGLSLLIRHRPDGIAPRLVRVALAGTLLAILVISVVLAVTTWRTVGGDAVLGSVVAPGIALLGVPTLGVGAVVALAALLRRCPSWLAAPLLIGLFTCAATQWDQRSQWGRTVEATALGQHPFVRFIPPDAQVYWHTELLPVWAMLDRASFVSPDQAAGIVFNRATAIELAHRSQPMLALLTAQVECQMAANAAGMNVECQPPRGLVEAFCRTHPAPDFMVFDARYPRGLVAQWDYRIARAGPTRTAYLYGCASMR